MKITINVKQPVYDIPSGLTTIRLTTPLAAQADIHIDFKKLLPFANLVPIEIVDFFNISAAIYGIDRFIERKVNSVDGWSRELSVEFPVADVKKWKAVKEELGALLSFQTGDYWTVDFYQNKFTFPNKPLEPEFNSTFAQVNLFSGGLDSLIGAIDFLKSKGNEKVLFTSHYDSQMHGPKGDQKDLLKEIEAVYPGRFAYIPSIRVSLDNSTIPKETTFRSRSILFIGIALMVAQTKKVPIVVPENGTVSLNYPLSPSRRSACSTRTTHPTVISAIRSLWKRLGIQTDISNPYELHTKGEMVKNCMDLPTLKTIVNVSNSCGKRGHRAHWDEPTASHCGICMPCVYRRASLLSMVDKTTYGNDINKLIPFNTQKGQDVGACLEYLKEPLTVKQIKDELIINGLKDLAQINAYVDVVLRTRKELKNWIKVIGNNVVKTKAGI